MIDVYLIAALTLIVFSRPIVRALHASRTSLWAAIAGRHRAADAPRGPSGQDG